MEWTASTPGDYVCETERHGYRIRRVGNYRWSVRVDGKEVARYGNRHDAKHRCMMIEVFGV
jgi:hypothetical protein